MKDPAVLFYFQDFLVGTEFMNDEEVGKYIRILCHQADKGALSESQLKRICRSEIPEAIKEKLKINGDGKYYQERMKIEKEKREKHIEHQRENANKRWKKSECDGNATAMPLLNENKDINENESLIDIAWLKWKEFKKAEFNFKYKSEISENAAKMELIKLSDNKEEIAISIIEQSIANGWKGLFKLKNNGTKKGDGATNAELAAIVAKHFGDG